MAFVSVAILATVCYAIYVAIYRLYLSPLAHFPGPKLAALTGWVEVWYDIVIGGQFTMQIEKWHKKYGPIIRIKPNEVHISDPDFYNELFTTTAAYQKPDDWRYRFGYGTALFDTSDHVHHNQRRAPLATFFSRSKILSFSSVMQEHIDGLVNRLQNKYRGQVVCVNKAFDALTMDLIGFYAFGLDYHSTEYPNFDAPYYAVTEDVARMVHVAGHFPWVVTILQALPQKLLAFLSPPLKKTSKFQKEINSQIHKIVNGQNHMNMEHSTIFHAILNSKLDPSELTEKRLGHEAGSLVGAALETSKMTASLAVYYVLAKPEIYKKLKEELNAAMPDPEKSLSVPELEQLPYLSAVIKEALRLSIGVSQRIRRYSDNQPIYYGKYVIPPGTVFGMCHWEQLRDPRIWDRPTEFLPDRWLGDEPKALNGQPLAKYFVPFHRGTRMCLGKEMGMAQLNMGLATLFRRLDLELFESGQDTVDIVADYFVPLVKEGSKGVRVLVK
ncbi:cytochrome P450 monooxygenase [Fusarium beomiforme]|uniref:Cytochrome P450 monooxygenase n=1 Tax=Fusarium beomiforme TaxID=44412 RepID=A0A9P5DUE0_9HYPO|nr:cytochrome P450 monooxygenase [Fusarium beomiforme]